ncbi:glycoside hydrolase family beta-glycosidase [gut metagenome]|uniref:beta-N-acetylhexosaminidase n=1 Tax=gut metagenome TaxID=749906 RepID=J9CPT4_9ZZZZ
MMNLTGGLKKNVWWMFLLLTGMTVKASEPYIAQSIKNDLRCQQWVDSVMAKMSLKERIGQLFIYTIAPTMDASNRALLHKVVKEYKIGGLLFSGGLMENQVRLTNEAQQMTDVPLMITFDGEWGLAMRLKNTPKFPRNKVLGAIQEDSLIYEYGREVARQCKEIGVHVNFAPVADVNINPNNPVIGTRAFGDDAELVARKVIAYAKGLESGGVLSVAKHFPGHGDTDVDSHKALPLLPFTRERLDSIELYPFRKAISAGISGVMVGHLEVPALEPEKGRPSSLSHKIVHDLLQEEMGFKGLVFTDALAMKGVGSGQTLCLQALKAGNDLLLVPRRLKEEAAAIMTAVKKGELPRSLIDAKCRKVLTYKYALGLTKRPSIQLSGLDYRIHTEYTTRLIQRLKEAAERGERLRNKPSAFQWEKLKEIDAVAKEGIQKGAYPGCQIVVMKDGKIMYDKSFGTHEWVKSAGVKPQAVRSTDVYDLASLTKVTATLLAVMKLYDKGMVNLTDHVSKYLSYLRNTDKKQITVRELLLHESGLPSTLLFYQEAIDKESYTGPLFKAQADRSHPVRIGKRTWANPHFRFMKGLTYPTCTDSCSMQVSGKLWIRPDFKDVYRQKIAETPLRDKRYRYSCVGFIVLQQLVEELSGKTLDRFLQDEFYTPMGLKRTGYLPLRTIPKKEIIPSSRDLFLRKETLQGYVHDESAAFQGGISGNAGLFSTAEEVAKICQLWLNGGTYEGKRYLSEETCRLFTTVVSKKSRRGLGFDKPDTQNPTKSPCGELTPASVYGHTGFTGTCAWVDPEHRMIYVFLCNRLYPDVWNTKLTALDIRTRIQDVLYKSLNF